MVGFVSGFFAVALALRGFFCRCFVALCVLVRIVGRFLGNLQYVSG
jgi:hypothetical protein